MRGFAAMMAETTFVKVLEGWEAVCHGGWRRFSFNTCSGFRGLRKVVDQWCFSLVVMVDGKSSGVVASPTAGLAIPIQGDAAKNSPCFWIGSFTVRNHPDYPLTTHHQTSQLEVEVGAHSVRGLKGYYIAAHLRVTTHHVVYRRCCPGEAVGAE